MAAKVAPPSYNVAMCVRSPCSALVFLGFLGVAECQCAKDTPALGVIHLQNELRIRPRKIKVRQLHLLNVSSGSASKLSEVGAPLVGLGFLENRKDEAGETIRDALQRSGFFEAHIQTIMLEAPEGANPPTVSVIAREAHSMFAIRWRCRNPMRGRYLGKSAKGFSSVSSE